MLFLLVLSAPVVCVAQSHNVDPCALDLPSVLTGGYNNVSTIFVPLDPTSKVRNLLAGKTVRFVAHYDAGRVEHSQWSEVENCPDCAWPDIFICAPHLPNRQCASNGGVRGRDVDVVSAIAARGNFHVEWAVSRDLSPTWNEKYTPLAVNYTMDERFDVSGNWWTDTEERRKLGMVVGHHHTDASRVLVTRDSKPITSPLDLDLLTKPYTNPVWFSFWATLVLYSMFMLTVERRGWAYDKRLGKTKAQRFISGTVYEAWLGFERFNGGDPNPPHGPSDPKTRMGRAMTSLWGTFVVLFIAMYTAKLASILVSQDSDSNSIKQIRSLTDVRDFGGGRILVFNGEPMKQRILNTHPYLRITEAGKLSEMSSAKISSLFDEFGAEAIILPIATAQAVVLHANNCDVSITAPVQVSGGGFIASVSRCRADLHVVLDGLLMEIENDGTVDVITRRYQGIDQCDGATGGDSSDGTFSTSSSNKDDGLSAPLSMNQMFGLYMFVAGGMTLIWTIWQIEKRYHIFDLNYHEPKLITVEVGGGGVGLKVVGRANEDEKVYEQSVSTTNKKGVIETFTEIEDEDIESDDGVDGFESAVEDDDS